MQTQWGVAPWFLYDNKLIPVPYYILYKSAILMCQIATYLGMTSFDGPCSQSIFTIFEHAGLNNDPFDIQEKYSENPYDKILSMYLNEPEVQKALGVHQYFVPGNESIFEMMLHDFPISFVPDLSLALNSGLSVYLIYGDKDYVCTWQGGELVANSLDWAGHYEFVKVPYRDWIFNGSYLGKYRRLSNLSFVTVRNAGHWIFNKQRLFGAEILKTWMQVN